MSEPFYQKIYDALKQDIENGTYRPGDQVPTEEALAKAFGVSKITSKRSLNMLAEDGYLSRQKGRGSFVTERAVELSLSSEDQSRISDSDARSSAPVSANGPSDSDAAFFHSSEWSRTADQLPRIGLIYPSINSHFGTTAVAAIADACRGQAHLLLSLSHNDTRREEEAILSMIQAPVDGLIVFPGSSQFLNPHLLQMVIDKYPLVLIDQNIQAIRQTSVGTDNTDAVFQALSYMVHHGHRNVSVMLPTIVNNVLQERQEAVFQYSATTGFPLHQELWLNDVNIPSDDIPEKDISRIARHLLSHPEITSVFAFHYAIAVAVKQAAVRIGRRLGEDLAVLCFDSPRLLLEKPCFTHIRQNEAAIGQKAVELLLDLIRRPGLPPQNVQIQAELVEGESFFTLT